MGGGKGELKKTMIIAMMMTMRLIIGKRDGEKAEGGWERVGKEEKGLGGREEETVEEEEEEKEQIMGN